MSKEDGHLADLRHPEPLHHPLVIADAPNTRVRVHPHCCLPDHGAAISTAVTRTHHHLKYGPTIINDVIITFVPLQSTTYNDSNLFPSLTPPQINLRMFVVYAVPKKKRLLPVDSADHKREH